MCVCGPSHYQTCMFLLSGSPPHPQGKPAQSAASVINSSQLNCNYFIVWLYCQHRLASDWLLGWLTTESVFKAADCVSWWAADVLHLKKSLHVVIVKTPSVLFLWCVSESELRTEIPQLCAVTWIFQRLYLGFLRVNCVLLWLKHTFNQEIYFFSFLQHATPSLLIIYDLVLAADVEECSVLIPLDPSMAFKTVSLCGGVDCAVLLPFASETGQESPTLY